MAADTGMTAAKTGGEAPSSDALEQAARLDGEKRFQESLRVLSAAAGAGDAAAKREVGCRILLGDRAPAMGAPGAKLLEEAAQEGDARAAAIAAVLSAAGAFRERSWSRALDFLQRAAELGDAESRGALAALAGETAFADGADAAGPETWGRLRSGLDPAWFDSAPEGRTLNEAPLIRAFGDFAPPAICDWMIARSQGRLSRAHVYDAVSQTVGVHETRTNTAAKFGLLEADLVQLAIQSRMAAAAGVPPSHLESPAVLHYAEGEQITEHFDFIDPNAPDHDRQILRDGQRIVTFLLYLNEDYAGGETAFPRLDLSHKGRTGEAMFFVNALPDGKADVRTVHAGRPPVGGEKWIVSQFIRNRPSLPGAAPAATAHPTPR